MTMKFYASQIIAMSEVDRGNVAQWLWNNTAVSGKNLITGFNNTFAGTVSDWNKFVVYAPKLHGKAILNYNTSSSALFPNATIRRNIRHVDLQHVPAYTDRMVCFFQGFSNIVSVVNINNNVKYLSSGFYECYRFNYNVKLPSNLLQMDGIFQSCYAFNQNIKIPSKVTNMRGAFGSCSNFNQNISIPSSVTDLSRTFYGCSNLNQNIQIPESAKIMENSFYGCRKLNQSIQIPKSVYSMNNTFEDCTALSTRINVLSTEINSSTGTFNNTSAAKQVYIYYKYKNGVTTKTYNQVVGGSFANRWNGKNGVTVYDLGSAPW